MAYIKLEQIQEKEQEIKNLSSDLETLITDFTNKVNEIQDILDGLKVCLNTTGGLNKIKEISNINFDTQKLNNMKKEINEIKITYSKSDKIYLSNQ